MVMADTEFRVISDDARNSSRAQKYTAIWDLLASGKTVFVPSASTNPHDGDGSGRVHNALLMRARGSDQRVRSKKVTDNGESGLALWLEARS